jgi:hypothetical protein
VNQDLKLKGIAAKIGEYWMALMFFLIKGAVFQVFIIFGPASDYF